MRPGFDAVVEEICTGALHEVDERQFFGLRNVHCGDDFFKCHLGRRPGVDAAVVDQHHAADAADETDPRYATRAWNTGLRARVLDKETREPAGFVVSMLSSQMAMGTSTEGEQAMWEGLELLGDQISQDEARQHEEAEQTRSRIERIALALSTGVLALIARASSLTAMALSSLPVWQRLDPLSVLALSDRERKEREKELRDAEILEAEGAVGDLIEGQAKPDPDRGKANPEHNRRESDRDRDDEEIDA